MPTRMVIWYGDDQHRHVEYVEAASDLDAVAITLRRHPNAWSARPIPGYAVR